MSDASYPRTMVHPSARKSVITRPIDPTSGRPDMSTAYGTPDRFTPVTVGNATQEAYYRSQGYHMTGEPAVATRHYDFPMYLSHATAEPVLVKSADELAAREAEGYLAVGYSNADAFERSSAVPYVPGQVIEEWPKMIGTTVVADPARADGFAEYPKYVAGQVVNSRAEEEALVGARPLAVSIGPAESPKRGRKPMTLEQKARATANLAAARAARKAKQAA